MSSNYHAGSEHDIHNRHPSPQQTYHGYRQVHPSSVEVGMQHHRYSNGSAHAPRMTGSPSPRHVRQGSMRSIQSSPRALHASPRLQRLGTPTSAVGRAAYSMSPPPIFDSAGRMAHRTIEPHIMDDPALPSREITERNIDDSYIKFIFYANPGVPKETDTAELRRAFRSPPRSDGKSFSTFTLWQLIRRLHNKDLKTWTQLAIELGVEPPSAEKGQSSQKIQQYAVRLKRWMRAMHVDAFFEFCLGKAHRYFVELPSATANPSDDVRDGVPLEEDLALRALMPEWRPKRGRKKNDEKEPDTAIEQPAAKRPHLDQHHSAIEYTGLGVHSAAFPENAPWSAMPDDINANGWNVSSAIPQGRLIQGHPNANVLSDRGGYEYQRWGRDISPSGYPQSAVTLGHRQPETTIMEPRSAIVPSGSKSRSRRKHGPAVSSAWTSGAGRGKQRGRPPAPRAQDEIHSALPPEREDPPYLVHSQSLQSIEQQHHHNSLRHPSPLTQARPSKLQLQVPERLGGPVRLATPPMVLLNGNGNGNSHSRLRRNSVDYFRNPDPEDEDGESIVIIREPSHSHAPPEPTDDVFTVEDVARIFATRLLRIKIIGRPIDLSLEEADMLAHKAVLSIYGNPSSPSTLTSHRPSKALAIKCALILGVDQEMGVSSTSMTSTHLTVRAVFQDAHGVVVRGHKSARAAAAANSNGSGAYNYTISIDTTNKLGTFSSNVQIRDLIVPAQGTGGAGGGGGAGGIGGGMEDEGGFEALREQIRVLSEVPMSAVEPDMEINGRGNHDGDGDGGGGGNGDTSDVWRQRFLEGRRDGMVAEEKVRRLKRLMLEVVMGSG